MQRQIIDLVNDFNVWRGNSFTLATLVAQLVKEKAVEIVEADGHTETADKLRGL